MKKFIIPKFFLVYLSIISATYTMESPLTSIKVIQPDGKKTMLKVNLNQSLSEFRLELTSKNRLTSQDIFLHEECEIQLDDEKEWSIRDILEANTLSLKPRDTIVSNLFGSMVSSPQQVSASQYKQPVEFKLSSLSSSSNLNDYSIMPEDSTATTSDIIDYNSLSSNQREQLFDSLKLRNAINLIMGDLNGDVKIRSSFRSSVVWDKEPDWKYPDRDLTSNKSYSLSKAAHELKKSNITQATVGVGYLGISLDTQSQLNNEKLTKREDTEIYLLSSYNVPKVELSIQARYINLSSDLEELIKEVINEKNMDSYKVLINIFEDYGFCIPTTFGLGGQIYCEDRRRVSSFEDAESTEYTFAAAVDANFAAWKASGGGGHSKAEQQTSNTIGVTHNINKLVTGGDVALANDYVQWMTSLGAFTRWRVIERGNFYPVIEFLRPTIKKECHELIRLFYEGDMREISLEGMKASLKDKISLTSLSSPQSLEQKGSLTRMVKPSDEEIYRRFLKGRLIYKPKGELLVEKERSNVENNMTVSELPIAALRKPLDDKFDLSQCGASSKHITISTGYRKEVTGNKDMLEIWITPRYLVEKEVHGTARHLQGIFLTSWPETCPIGIFWNSGSMALGEYDYLTNRFIEDLGSADLCNLWAESTPSPRLLHNALLKRKMTFESSGGGTVSISVSSNNPYVATGRYTNVTDAHDKAFTTILSSPNWLGQRSTAGKIYSRFIVRFTN